MYQEKARSSFLQHMAAEFSTQVSHEWILQAEEHVWTQQAANGKIMNKIIKTNREKRTLRHVRRPSIRPTVEQKYKNKHTNGKFSNTEFTVPQSNHHPETWHHDAHPTCNIQLCTHTICSVSKAFQIFIMGIGQLLSYLKKLHLCTSSFQTLIYI